MCGLARLILPLTLACLALSNSPLAALETEKELEELRESLPTDRVELANGRTHKGWVLAQSEDEVVLLMGSRPKSYPLEKVSNVRSRHELLREALLDLDATPPEQITARTELAKTWESQGLALEARLLWWEILLQDPEHEEAHERLGHRRRNGHWRAKVGTSWKRLEDLDEFHADFAEARWLATTHFNVRTDMRLDKCLPIVWMLERIYLSMYDVFGEEFGLYFTADPLETYLYATPDAFPKIAGQRSWYSPADRRAHVGWWQEPHKTVRHETCHQILHGASLALGDRAEMPGWLDEGLAQYIAHALDDRGNWIEGQGDRAGVAPDLFRYHLGAESDYGLKRILNFESGDFHGSSGHYEKYALSYTLTHYLLHADGRVHRPAFVSFVRSALHDGKSSATHFKKAMGVKREKEFQTRWEEYVRATVGS